MTRSKRIFLTIAVVVLLAGAGPAEYLTSGAPSPCTGVSTGLATVASPAVRPPSAAGAVVEEVPRGAPGRPALAAPPLEVVAAENFWGSLAAEIGGNQTNVLSIVTDPNADPHEYEANTSIARAVATASLVLVNGVGYDSWAVQLAASDGNSQQIVLNVGSLNGVLAGGGVFSGNPHLWYYPPYVNRTLAAIFGALVQLRPSFASGFGANYARLNASLAATFGLADQIRSMYAGTVVAATEDLAVYLADYAGLDLVSPPEFMQAVAEGNDPTPASIVVFECQLETGRIHLLVYNEQTVSPLTAEVRSLAEAQHVPVVGLTETIVPPAATYAAWMGAQYQAISRALNTTAGAP